MTTRRKISQLPDTTAVQAGDEVAIRRGDSNLGLALGSAATKTAAAPGSATSGQLPTANSAGVLAREDGGTGEAFPTASNRYLGTNSAGQPGFHALEGASVPVWVSGSTYGLGQIVAQAASQNARFYRSLKTNNTDTLLTEASWQAIGVPPTSEVPVPQTGINAANGSTLNAVLANNGTLGNMEWKLLSPENLDAGQPGVDRILISTGNQGMKWGLIEAGSLASGSVTSDKLHESSFGYEETKIWEASALANGVWSATTSATQTLPNSRSFDDYDQIVVITYGTADNAANAHISAPYDLAARRLALDSSLFNENARCEFALPGGAGVFGMLNSNQWNVRQSSAGNQVVILVGRRRRPIQ